LNSVQHRYLYDDCKFNVIGLILSSLIQQQYAKGGKNNAYEQGSNSKHSVVVDEDLQRLARAIQGRGDTGHWQNQRSVSTILSHSGESLSRESPVYYWSTTTVGMCQ
jgi:hypothetical protein